jgi:hypothetical protein
MIRDAFKDADRIEGDMGATTGSSWKTPPALSPRQCGLFKHLPTVCL